MKFRSINAAVLVILFASAAMIAQSQSGDKYKVVFASRKGDIKEWEDLEQRQHGLDEESGDLSEKINAIAASDYRLKTIRLPFAILARDPGNFSYSVIQEVAHNWDTSPAEGFRVSEHFYEGVGCTPSPLTPMQDSTCLPFNTYVYEKRLNSNQKITQIAEDDPDNSSGAEINQKFAEGYYPVKIISKNAILLEKGGQMPDFANYHPEFQVVRKDNGLEGKVNDLAKQGYRLLMADRDIALMYRNDKTRGIAVSYTWLNGQRRDLPKQLSELEQKGARYCTLSADKNYEKNILVFEIPSQKTAARSEFRMLKFPLDWKTDPADGKNFLDLTPDGQTGLKQLNDLANSGFEVRDLFLNGDIAVLLEREH